MKTLLMTAATTIVPIASAFAGSGGAAPDRAPVTGLLALAVCAGLMMAWRRIKA